MTITAPSNSAPFVQVRNDINAPCTEVPLSSQNSTINDVSKNIFSREEFDNKVEKNRVYLKAEAYVEVREKVAKESKKKTGELDLSNYGLTSNEITSLAPDLNKLTHLKVLRIGGNNFAKEGIPEAVFDLINLKELYINFSKLTNLSENIGKLVNLRNLNLNDNELEFLPEEIGNMKELEDFGLYSNRLVVIPRTIGKLENLKKLYLGASVIANLPDELGDLKSLEVLHIFNTQNLNYLPMSMKKCSKLTTILLDVMDPNPPLVADRTKILSVSAI